MVDSQAIHSSAGKRCISILNNEFPHDEGIYIQANRVNMDKDKYMTNANADAVFFSERYAAAVGRPALHTASQTDRPGATTHAPRTPDVQ